MMTTPRTIRGLLAGSLATLVLASLTTVATAQEPKAGEASKTRTIDIKGLTIEVPEGWEQQRSTSAMRAAEIQVPAAEGDKAPGELVVFVFPEGAGTVEANVQRWQQQFRGADGQTPEVQSEQVQGKNVEVTRVEVAGTYVEPPFSGGGTYPDYRLLGAIVETPGAAYYFKLVGPDRTIQAAAEEFDALIASMSMAR